MYLEIITPERKAFTGKISLIKVPGSKGSFEVLNNHAPIISTLNEGEMKVITEDQTTFHLWLIGGGVIEVSDNNVILLAEGVEEETTDQQQL